MTQCKGKTRSGNRCKLDAQPDSDFCHLHGNAGEKGRTEEEGASEIAFGFEDLVPLIMAGAMAAGFFVLVKTLGRWIPRL